VRHGFACHGRNSDDDLRPCCAAAALGLLFNGQPFSAILNFVLIVFCLIFGIFFHILLLVPSSHAIIAVHMKREDRRHREVVSAIRRYGPPPGYPR
jgi:hypothetical protein